MKKSVLVSLAGITLLSLGLVENTQSNNIVQATTVHVGKNQNLVRNSYIYNAKGKRVSGIIDKGISFKIRGIKKINGKKYVQIGKNEFIRLINFTAKKAKKSTGWLNRNSYVYNRNGVRISKKTLQFGHNITILNTKTIKGHKYIQIGRNKFIRAVNVTYFNDTPEINSNNVKKTNDNSNKNVAFNPNSSPTNSNHSQNSNGNNSNNTSKSNSQSVNKKDNSNSQEDTNNSSFENMTALHNSYTYDQDGKRNLGGFIIKGKKYNFDGKKTINGKAYYIYNHSVYEDDFVEEYVPVSAFEKDGKDQKFNPAPIKELVKYQFSIDQIPVDHYKLEMSSSDKQKAFRKAQLIMHRVGEMRWSSEKDMETAKNDYEKAIRDLDGQPIIVHGSWNNFILTPEQRTQIIALANKYLKTDDAVLEDNDSTIYYSNKWGTPSTVPVSEFVEFVK